MKAKLSILALALLVLVSFPPQAWSLEAGKIVFCKNISDDWKPVGENATFDTHIITWLSHAAKPYGSPTITLSIYRHDGAKEHLVKRENMDVRPTWDTTGIRNMTLPKEGKYTLALDLPNGTSISSGTVTVTKMQQASASVRAEPLGTSLADIFNKYKGKQ